MLAALFILVISYIFTLVRVSYCRFRYDYLISFAWKSLLPTSLMLLTLSYCLV
jgi:NADH:ubiquinone oxidoreductase subunit H